MKCQGVGEKGRGREEQGGEDRQDVSSQASLFRRGGGWGACVSDLGAEVGEGICQGCGRAESRAAGEWNEKAVKWQSKCLWEMERKTLS